MAQRLIGNLSTAVLLTALSARTALSISPQRPVLELDHVYIVVSPGAAAAVEALRQVGFVVDSSVTRHVGQGTASKGVVFENGYLELAWVDSTVALDSAHGPDRAAFIRAAAWRESGASPFGVGLHVLAGTTADLGLPVRLYSAAWMRPSTYIVLLRQPSESLTVDMFIVPDYMTFTSWLTRNMGRRPELLRHAVGVRRITAVVLHGRADQRPRAASLEPRLVRFEDSNSPYLELEFDGAARRQMSDLRPLVPLVLRY